MAFFSLIFFIFDIGPDLLELFDNVNTVWFFTTE